MRRGAGRLEVALGAAVWALLAGLGWARLHDPSDGRDRRAMEGLASYLLDRQVPAVLRFPHRVDIGVGDPIYYRDAAGALTLCGEVTELLRNGRPLAIDDLMSAGVEEARVSLRLAACGAAEGLEARLIAVPQTASWVLRTLLPPEKLRQIAVEWNDTLLEHREEIFSALAPLVRETLRDLESMLEQDLPRVLEAHRERLGAIGQRLNDEIVQNEFEPLLRDELWPIVERRVQPAMDAIGQELWKRLPLWSFTWRFLYQSLPLTSDSYLKEEVDRFWREETIPILKEHSGEFLAIFQDIVREAASNPRVSTAFRQSFSRLLHDRELQGQLGLIFQEVILDNPRLHQKLAERWRSPHAVRALEVLLVRLEPMARRVGDILLGTRGGGITPEFARVLRTQILEKDRRWVILEATSASAPRLEPGTVIRARLERP